MNNAQLREEALRHKAAGLKAYDMLRIYTDLLKRIVKEFNGTITVSYEDEINDKLIISDDSKNKRVTLTLESRNE